MQVVVVVVEDFICEAARNGIQIRRRARALSHSHTHTGVQYLGRDRKVFACPSMRNEWARAGHYFRYRCYSEITNVSPMRQLKLVVAGELVRLNHLIIPTPISLYERDNEDFNFTFFRVGTD